MKTVKLVVLLVFVTALLVFALQNTVPVHVRFLWMAGEVPVFLLFLVTASGGFVLGLVVALLGRGGAAK